MATIAEALQLAVQQHRAGRLVQAEQVYQEILKMQPDHSESLYGLGVLAQQQGQYQKAEEWLTALLRLQPRSVKAWFSLGNLRQAQGQLSEATNCYQQALAIEPDAVAVLNNLGHTWQQQGKWDEAIACYQKALEIDPNCPEADANWGNALDHQGKLSPEQQARYAALNNQLGETRRQAGDYESAVAYYQQAIALQPEAAIAHYHLGVARQEQGQLEAAIPCYEQALKLNPEDGKVYMSLGKLYNQQHRFSEASAAYRQGLSLLNSDYAEAVSAYPAQLAAADYTTPQLTLGEVTVGEYKFPAIPPPQSEDKRPFWTVIIPLYNRKEYLLECLASVLAQWKEGEMEILAMDNASTPPLFELVNGIGGGIVGYYRNPQNLGPRRNFNLGIALSRGQWIHLIPEDEYVLPSFYSRLKKSLETQSDSVGAGFTGYENINEQGKVIFSQPHQGLHQGINQNWLGRIGRSNPLNPCAVVIRRAAHERLGGYDPENIYAPDWELYKRIASFYDWWFEPGILARYRQHSNNMSTEVFLAGEQGKFYRQAIEISESYLPAEHCAEITAQARRHYFTLCLDQAVIPLKAGNLIGAWRLVQEALKIDSSPPAVSKLFAWLARDEAAPLRNEMVSKLVSLPLNDSKTSEFYFAYP